MTSKTASTTCETNEWSVIIHELKADEESCDLVASGFSSEAEAAEYARRRTWSSIEEQKSAGKSPKDIKQDWMMWGETTWVLGEKKYSGTNDADFFIQNAPQPQNIDYKEIETQLGQKFTIKKF